MIAASIFFIWGTLKGQHLELFSLNVDSIVHWYERTNGEKYFIIAIVSVLTYTIIHSTVKFTRPEIYFMCDSRGVYLGKNKDYFDWSNVIDIHPGQMKIGTSRNRGETYATTTAAVMIKLNGDYLDKSGWHRVAAKPTTANIFGFIAKKPDKMIEKICEFWFASNVTGTVETSEQVELSDVEKSIKQLVESGAMVQAIKKCRKEFSVSISEAKEIINKIT